MPARRRSRIYWRERGGERRGYADFRDFADVGGKREALAPPGEVRASSDPVIAEKLVADRLKDLQERRRNKTLLGIDRQTTLHEYATYHLVQKAKGGRFTEQWLNAVEMHLRAAVNFFGAGRDPASIGAKDVQRYIVHLRSIPNGRGKTLGHSSVRKYLNSVSNLYRRAAGEGYVPPGYNPVAILIDKPCETRHEAGWLEVPDAALFLEAARTHKADAKRDSIPFPHALIATFLLTGGRTSEVLGLRVGDLSFDRRTVTFRPNEYRRLKTATSHRSAPLWPQLEEILREYVFGGDQPRSGLLFPSPRTGRMIRDTRKLLDALAARSGFERGQVRTRIFRHTYCAARLQTVDRGAPVSPYTVAKELGHGGLSLVERVYGHLGDVRHRSEVVEFRVEQHSTLGERLARLRTG